jgi:hypothetical protein
MDSHADQTDRSVPGPPSDGRIDLRSIREVSWPTLLAVVVTTSALTALLWYLISISWEPLLTVERVARESTGGFVQLTLLIYAALLLVVVVGLVGWVGGLRPADLSLGRSALETGVVVTAGLWLVLQVVGAATQFLAGEPVAVNDYWTAENALLLVGMLVAQLFGNALYEEVVFRAFLINQLRHKLTRRFTLSPRRVFLVAIVTSQLLFALVHVPARLMDTPPTAIPGRLLVVFLIGVLLALVYYRTANLFVAIGIHALVNTPTMVIGDPSVGSLTALVLALVLVVVWPWAERRVQPEPAAIPPAA